MRAVVCSLLLAACTAAAPRSAPRPSASAVPPPVDAPSARSPVVVLVVVDQLGSWVFERRRDTFSPAGGFRQLLDQGTYAPQLRYEHATTSTAPGHAALFTGLPPRESGVFANERLDENDKAGSVFGDPTTHPVAHEALPGHGSSPAALRAPTIADALRAAHPDAPIIALSLKDRASIPGGGRQPTLSVWFDPERERFVSSSTFADALPSWLLELDADLKRELGGTWNPADEGWLERHAPTPDEQRGEGDFGPTVRFPYDLGKASHRGKAFRGYPAADRAVLSLARAALKSLPNDARHDAPVLLVLSLSAFDYVGHVHGPDSWESWEVLRELDRELGVFFDELEGRFGERLSIVLSADHGTAPLPETAGDLRARPWCGSSPAPFELPCDRGERLLRAELEQRAEKAARSALGPGEWVRGVVEPFVYFTRRAQELAPARRDALEQACITALQEHPGVARVFSTRRFAADCPPVGDESLEALVCRSVTPDAGQLYVVSRPGSFFDPNLVPGRGINHGSPHLYDRTVPVLVRSGLGRGAGRVVPDVLRPADVTATAAALLRVSPPRGAAGGRVLIAE
jgi:Type I phosphodiesterase / nucleotide pyrophosphatase